MSHLETEVLTGQANSSGRVRQFNASRPQDPCPAQDIDGNIKRTYREVVIRAGFVPDRGYSLTPHLQPGHNPLNHLLRNMMGTVNLLLYKKRMKTCYIIDLEQQFIEREQDMVENKTGNPKGSLIRSFFVPSPFQRLITGR